jgi:hypothetical protein
MHRSVRDEVLSITVLPRRNYASDLVGRFEIVAREDRIADNGIRVRSASKPTGNFQVSPQKSISRKFVILHLCVQSDTEDDEDEVAEEDA